MIGFILLCLAIFITAFFLLRDKKSDVIEKTEETNEDIETLEEKIKRQIREIEDETVSNKSEIKNKRELLERKIRKSDEDDNV